MSPAIEVRNIRERASARIFADMAENGLAAVGAISKQFK
jgi:hypothetical protein